MQERSGSIYTLSHAGILTKKNVIAALNELPEGCFTCTGEETHVRVIGWGQWADFLQRHLCHAIQQNFYFMNHIWGVPDDAKEYAAKCEKSFDGLRLYPFVRRFNCTDVAAYHKAVDDGFRASDCRHAALGAGTMLELSVLQCQLCSAISAQS